MREFPLFLSIRPFHGYSLPVPFLQPVFILALLIALSVHEWAHAFIATRLGDPTPRHAGRLTLNPLAHIDPIGAILFLIAGFGWAKPVPVNSSYFRNPRRDVLLVAAAGPASNLLIAVVCYTALLLLGGSSQSAWELLGVGGTGNVAITFFRQFFGASLFVNLGLMAFNLIPIAPLDGSKVLEAFIPLRLQDKYDDFMRMGPYILLALFIGEHLLNLPLLSFWIVHIIDGTLYAMDAVIGRFL
jgi:Zn-dependent protease